MNNGNRGMTYKIIICACVMFNMGYTIIENRQITNKLNILKTTYAEFSETAEKREKEQIEKIQGLKDTLNKTAEDINTVLSNNIRLYDILVTDMIDPYPSMDDIAIPMDVYNEVIKRCGAIDFDPDLVLAIMCEESGFDVEKVQGKKYGLGQLSETTGMFIHTKILKKKTKYDHGQLLHVGYSTEYVVAYMNYLYDKNNGNIEKVVSEYSGLTDTFELKRYLGRIEAFMTGL
ncbi:MAG: transglycosylase SLT domain-containing protein [Fusobacteriaceae bacterium]